MLGPHGSLRDPSLVGVRRMNRPGADCFSALAVRWFLRHCQPAETVSGSPVPSAVSPSPSPAGVF
jgi:hypothetical protein